MGGDLDAAAALRLSKVFGTTPGFWMNHQLRWGLFYAEREAKRALERIEPVPREDLVGAGQRARARLTTLSLRDVRGLA